VAQLQKDLIFLQHALEQQQSQQNHVAVGLYQQLFSLCQVRTACGPSICFLPLFLTPISYPCFLPLFLTPISYPYFLPLFLTPVSHPYFLLLFLSRISCPYFLIWMLCLFPFPSFVPAAAQPVPGESYNLRTSYLPFFDQYQMVVWVRDQEPCVHGLGVLGHGHCWSYILIDCFQIGCGRKAYHLCIIFDSVDFCGAARSSLLCTVLWNNRHFLGACCAVEPAEVTSQLPLSKHQGIDYMSIVPKHST
jgi:hypothetical protein